jgi:DNA-binding protein YbaB
MVRFRIDIEAVADDPEALNIMLKTESNEAAEAEETAAQRLLPALRNLLKSGFPQGDES